MSSRMNFDRIGKGNSPEKRTAGDASVKKKQQTGMAYHTLKQTPAQIDQQLAIDKARTFKSDAEVVLVNLTLTATISRSDLRKNLAAKNLKFDDGYLKQLLAYLQDKRRAVAKGDAWKRA
ncbi:MAG: hypothetical protein EON60_13200 [Alphaproteobacteria bacterium]|nr:MAG: hypothetical protein EON60_13200 [Alphaproteobacteria bacterium]